MFIQDIKQEELKEFYKLHQGNKREEELNKSIKARLATGAKVEPGHYTASLEARYTTPQQWKEDALAQLIVAFGEPAKVIVANVKKLAEAGKTASHILKVEHKPTRK